MKTFSTFTFALLLCNGVFAQEGSPINQAEKRAIQLFTPVDFTRTIVDQITLPQVYSGGPYQVVLMQTIEAQVRDARVRLIHDLANYRRSYSNAILYRDSVKTALIHDWSNLTREQWDRLFIDVTEHERDDHEYVFETRGVNQPCANPDFESCNFSSWDLITGVVPYPSPAPYSFNSPTPTTAFATISTPTASGGIQHYITTGGTSAVGGFPQVFPGGTCSAAIGNFTTSGNGAAQLKQTFLVSNSNAILTLHYAVVLQDAGHTANEQPYFRVRVYDQSGASIACAAYEAVAGDGQPGWTPYSGGQYKPWTTVFFPMAAYIGQNVTVEFTVGDCAQGGHYGYAYVDASCSSMDLALTASSICSGSPITITAPAGAASYIWSTGQTGQSINVATGGTYSVVVTPLTGSACSVTLDTTVGAFPNPTADFIQDAPTCTNNPVNFTDLSLPNGSTITQWTWDFGDGTGSNVQNTTHAYTTAGNYNASLTVTTADGCTQTATQALTINNFSDATITPAGPFCIESPPTTLTAVDPGGSWSATCGACIDASTGVFNPALAGPGSHTITYEITGVCPGIDDVVINVQQVTIDNVFTTNVDCFGNATGLINITSTGGTSFSIDNGATFQPGNVFAGLLANNYNLVVQNALGCVATSTATITEPTQLSVLVSPGAESCFGACDGSVTAVPSGGTPPYNINWTGDATGTGSPFSSLCVGNYTANITDNNGCTVSDFTVCTGPSQVVIDAINATPELCHGDCQGTIEVMTSGGTGGYTYSIDGGVVFQPNNIFTNVCAGNYNIVVRDNTNCSATGITNINTPPVIALAVSPDVFVCINSTTTITANAVGGVGGFNYTWDNGLEGASHVVDPAAGVNVYTVTVTDTNNCTASAPVTVTEYPPLQVITGIDSAVCPGFPATLTAVGSGGNGGPYTYTWEDENNNPVGTGSSIILVPSATTQYTVTVEDNCTTPSDDDNILITVHPLPAVQYSADDLDGCTPVVVNFSNTTDPLLSGQCLWNFGDSTTSNSCDVQHVFTEPGCYDISLQVTTINGCIVDTIINNQICVYPYPVPEFFYGPQPTDVYRPDIAFTNATTGASTYHWDFAGLGESTVLHPTFRFPDENGGSYMVCLTATNVYGCVDSVCHPVRIDGDFILHVPNAFTPDGDGKNEMFLPIMQGHVEGTYEFWIFDRWGEVIFYTQNELMGWDGTHKGLKAKDDVYVWQIKIKSSVDHERKVFRGHVSLLR